MVIGLEHRVRLATLCCYAPHTYTHIWTLAANLNKRKDTGWRKERGGCSHADVATVTAVSKAWELEGIRLEKRSEEDDIRRIQMRPRSLPVDPVSYPITIAVRGRRERGARGCRELGVGVGFFTENKDRETVLVSA